jgi:hypothetical protein
MVGLTFPLMFGIETSIPASCWIIVQQVIVVVMSCPGDRHDDGEFDWAHRTHSRVID